MSRHVIACIAALLLVGATGARGADRPNVIFILADDLGYGDLGSYGQKQIKTPNLDRIAAEGMRFMQFYSGSPVCGPARSCLLTGQHTGRTPIRANPGQTVGWDLPKLGDPPLPDAITTFGELFQQAGYETACVGKWGFNAPGTDGDPRKHGFGHFFGYANHRDAHKYYPEYLWRNDERVPLDGKTYAHDLIMREAMEFLRRDHGKPFMLYLTPAIPHRPFDPPDAAPYENENWPAAAKNMAAMITRMDRGIGEILALLKERNFDQNTLIIFTSDNGSDSVDRYNVSFHQSNGPLRGEKGEVYEGGIRVPLIALWPGRIAAGSMSNHVSAFWDWVPTVADLLEVSPKQEVDGISMLPTLLGKPHEQKKHEFLYWEFRRDPGGMQAVRVGDFKGVRTNLSRQPNPKLELYNLKNDIAEKNDIAAEHPDVVRQIEQIMVKEHVPSERFPLLHGEYRKQS